MENKITVEGVVKWEPRIFEAKTAEQSDIAQLALEHTHQKSEKTSVFQVKQFANGDDNLAAAIRDEKVVEGTQLKVVGFLREAKWKTGDEWNSRIEISAFEYEVLGQPEGGGDISDEPDADDDDDIPF